MSSARSFDPVLDRLRTDLRRAQQALDRYLDDGVAPPAAAIICAGALRPLAEAAQLVPLSDDTVRRHAARYKFGRQIGTRWFVDVDAMSRFYSRRGSR